MDSRAVEEIGADGPLDLLVGRHHRLAGPEANDVRRDDVPHREPDEVLGFPDSRLHSGFPQPAPDRRSREPEVVAMELGGDRDSAMHAVPQEPKGARRLAVHHVERARSVELVEGGGGRRQPVAIPEGPPGLPSRNVAEVPDPAEVLGARLSLGMPRRDDLDLMAGVREPSAEVGHVALHAPDSMGVARNRDDADPHARGGASSRRALS